MTTPLDGSSLLPAGLPGDTSMYRLHVPQLHNRYYLLSGPGSRAMEAFPEIVGFPCYTALLDEMVDAFHYLRSNGLGEEIGLYVYRNRSDADDDTYSHKNASPDVCAYTDSRVRLNREKDEYQLEYLIGVNTKFFETVDEDGNYHIDTSEEKLTDLDHTLVHEMLHVFMYDYNRTGATGMSDISVYVLNKYKYRRECEVNRFPGWFEEGLASSVEYNYNLRHDAFIYTRRL